MSETITKLDEHTFKITSNGIKEKTITAENLLQQKEEMFLMISRFENQVNETRQRLNSKMNDILDMISKARLAGIEIPE